MDNLNSTQPPEGGDSSARPTHKLKDVKVGDHGVQLLVSTKDHVYDAEMVEAGWNAWQVVGAWDESSVQQLATILEQRQIVPNDGAAGTARFGNAYGSGQVLGTSRNNGIRIVRQADSE